MVDVRVTVGFPQRSQVEVFVWMEFNYVLNFVSPRIRGILAHITPSVRKGIQDHSHQ